MENLSDRPEAVWHHFDSAWFCPYYSRRRAVLWRYPTLGWSIIFVGIIEACLRTSLTLYRLGWMLNQPAPAIFLGRHSYSSEFYRNDKSENIKDSTRWPYDGIF